MFLQALAEEVGRSFLALHAWRRRNNQNHRVTVLKVKLIGTYFSG